MFLLFQLKKKTEEIKSSLTRLTDLLLRRNLDLAGWAEERKEKNDGLACDVAEIKPSSVIDGYRNKCEFRVGKCEVTVLKFLTEELSSYSRSEFENFQDGGIRTPTFKFLFNNAVWF